MSIVKSLIRPHGGRIKFDANVGPSYQGEGKLDGKLMAVSTRQLDELIAQCEDRLARAKQRVVELQAELKGLQAAKESVSPSSRRPDGGRSRGPSFAWKQILGFLHKHPAGISIEEVADFVEGNKLDIQRHAVRSQLSNYNKTGIVEALGDGKYKITTKGVAFIGEVAGSGGDED